MTQITLDTTYHEALRQALFQHFEDGTPFESLSLSYNIPADHIEASYSRMMRNPPQAQPLSPSDIDVNNLAPGGRGRPMVLTAGEEATICKALKHFAENNAPLSKSGMQDLVECYVSGLPIYRRVKIPFVNDRPSICRIKNFIRRHDLSYRSVRAIEYGSVEAVSHETVATHISRVNVAITRYNIRDARLIFNLDETKVSFNKVTRRSLRKGIGSSKQSMVLSTIRKSGALDRITVMPVISAAGIAMKPVIVFPGRQAHYRRVDGQLQTLHNFLPPCYLHQRDVPGVNRNIFWDWAREFLMEPEDLRSGGQHILLLLDGYAAHLQARVLKLFMDNRVVLIAFPFHTSHVLQPLDVSVFSLFKSFMQRDVHALSKSKRVVNAFDVAQAVNIAYSFSLTTRNIQRGFERTGIWCPRKLFGSIDPLNELNFYGDSGMSLGELIRKFERQTRSLLRDADIEGSGTVRVSTRRGALLTSEAVLDALLERSEN